MLLNQTTCKCGKDLKEVRFDRYEQNHDVEFYGGRVHMIGVYKCECGRELKGYFSRNVNGELDLIDLEVLENIEEEEIIENEPILGQEFIAEGAKEEENAPYTIQNADVPVIEEKPKTKKKK